MYRNRSNIEVNTCCALSSRSPVHATSNNGSSCNPTPRTASLLCECMSERATSHTCLLCAPIARRNAAMRSARQYAGGSNAKHHKHSSAAVKEKKCEHKQHQHNLTSELGFVAQWHCGRVGCCSRRAEQRRRTRARCLTDAERSLHARQHIHTCTHTHANEISPQQDE